MEGRGLTLATACSGIGAPEEAARLLGWSSAWCAEVADFPSKVLAARHPESTNLGDLEALARGKTSIPAGRVDVLAAGTPCQSFSVAGLRRGMADPRGNLALAFLGLVQRVRPAWVLWENVPGVLSSNGGRDFGAFLGGLGELGYGWAYRVLDAQYFGVPQRRRRVFVVGRLGGWAGPAAVLLEPSCLRGNPPPRRQAREGVAGPLGAGAPGSGWRNDLDRSGAFIPSSAHAVRPREGARQDINGETFIPETAFALSRGGRNDGTVETFLTGGGFDARPIQSANRVRDRKQHGIGIGEPGDPMYTPDRRSDHAVAFDLAQVTSGENRSNPSPGGPSPSLNTTSASRVAIAFGARGSGQDAGEDLAPALRAGGHPNSAINGGMGPAVAYSVVPEGGQGAHLRASEVAVAPALTSTADARSTDRGTRVVQSFQASQSGTRVGDAHPTLDAHNGSRRHHGALIGSAVRRLTPEECERLQAFPTGYTRIPVAQVPRRRLQSPRAGEAYQEIDGEVWRLASDAARYEALGNSMAVCVVRWIFARFERAHRALTEGRAA